MSQAERVVSVGFHDRVAEMVRRVPPGCVATYGDIASMLGSPRVARHVGWALAALTDETVPWHRILSAHGKLPDDSRGMEQRARLVAEGAPFLASGAVDLRACRWLSAI